VSSVSVLGSGTVGTSVGIGLSKLGHKVIFYDTNERKVRSLRSRGFYATSCISRAVKNSRISLICVPTLTLQEEMDLHHVKAVTRKLGECLAKSRHYHVVVVKSTVLPGTTENVVMPLLEKHSGLRVGREIGLCMNPEFMTEIHRSWTDEDNFARGFLNEPVIVIGQFDKQSGSSLEVLYRELRFPVVHTNLKTAEMIKYAFNCALAGRISYWNEIFYICRALGIDASFVARTAASDPRIGEYGTVLGKAFGGKCLPKDLRAFIRFSRQVGHDPKLLAAVQDINLRIRAERGARE